MLRRLPMAFSSKRTASPTAPDLLLSVPFERYKPQNSYFNTRNHSQWKLWRLPNLKVSPLDYTYWNFTKNTESKEPLWIDVFWSNVGKTHKELQVGRLASLGLTTVLCLLWTIPMSTIATMSSIEGLREFEFVANMLDVMPWLEVRVLLVDIFRSYFHHFVVFQSNPCFDYHFIPWRISSVVV